MIANLAFPLLNAIIVDENNAATNINIRSQGRIANIR